MKNKNHFFLILVAGCFFVMCLLVWCFPKKEYSFSERRQLALMPEMSVKNILTGSYMNDFEQACLDQFPFRDAFRNLKVTLSTKKDEQGIYVAEDSIVSMEYPLNEESLSYAGNCFDNLYQQYLKDSQCRIYLAVVPDKNYFYAKDNGYLAYDYDKMVSILKEENDYMTYIDIFHDLSKEDYYKTDPHWKQEEIIPVAETILSEMGCENKWSYEIVDTHSQFQGSYANRIASKVPSDDIFYVTNEWIENYSVFDYEHNQEISVYDLEKLDSEDAYEMYMGGPISLVTIENPLSESDKELVIFRDSFGSSIAPLLALPYSKVTLVDIRYIQPYVLKHYIDFEKQDILFLYSSLVLNHSETLK